MNLFGRLLPPMGECLESLKSNGCGMEGPMTAIALPLSMSCNSKFISALKSLLRCVRFGCLAIFFGCRLFQQ